MAPLFGPSASDLEHLRSTVRALGNASVPGLSAALSWREHKVEKLLGYELARPTTPLVYDPARRTVRWATVVVPSPAPSAPAPPSAAASALRPAPPSTSPAPAPSYSPGGLKARCPHCRVALLSTGSNGLLVCPECGRLASARSAVAASAAHGSGPGAPPPARPVETGAPAPAVGAGDRRSQEMFAAWVTNQPIPCPKCRTPLRHHGVSTYGCPSCGQQVRFPTPGRATDPAPSVGTPVPASR